MLITDSDAMLLLKKLEINISVIPNGFNTWKKALQYELNHGYIITEKTSLTMYDLLKIGKIALSYLIEYPDYYERLETMEKKAETYWEKRKRPNLVSYIKDCL